MDVLVSVDQSSSIIHTTACHKHLRFLARWVGFTDRETVVLAGRSNPGSSIALEHGNLAGCC